MNTYPIPDALAGAYKGAGIALVAVDGGKIADLLYLRDLLPDYSDHDENGDGVNMAAIASRLRDHRLAPSIRHLEALGSVAIGMCSCWEFCEL